MLYISPVGCTAGSGQSYGSVPISGKTPGLPVVYKSSWTPPLNFGGPVRSFLGLWGRMEVVYFTPQLCCSGCPVLFGDYGVQCGMVFRRPGEVWGWGSIPSPEFISTLLMMGTCPLIQPNNFSIIISLSGVTKYCTGCTDPVYISTKERIDLT